MVIIMIENPSFEGYLPNKMVYTKLLKIQFSNMYI